MFTQILLAYMVTAVPTALPGSSNFTCPTTFNPNVCTATRYDLNFGTTCCKTVGYVYSKTGCIVRDSSFNPLKC